MMAGKIYNITSFSNSRIKEIKTLWRKKNRKQTNRFLAEGQKIIQEAMKANWKIKTFICLTDKQNKNLENLCLQLKQSGIDILFVNKAILAKLVNKENPSNCLAIIQQNIGDIENIKLQKNENYLALDRVRDSGNLGTIIRTCDCFGIRHIILIGECADIFSMETVRATMGSLFNVAIYTTSENQFIKAAQQWQKESGAKIITTSLGAKNYHDEIAYGKNANIIIMGNESQGISENLNVLANESVKIKMRKKADSLNLAIASGIVLYHVQNEKEK